MHTPEELREQLEKELEEFAADKQLMESPLWERWCIIFNLRRELLMAMNMNNEDDSVAKTNKLKGRYLENEYWLMMAEALRNGDVNARRTLDELDAQETEAALVEQRGEF